MITWLHVSDFHFRKGDNYDRDVVLRTLVKSVKESRTCGRAPDLIFATGDIAYSGKADEYKLATTFFDDLLDAAGLQRRHLFVVPGNHDVDRDQGCGLTRTLSSQEEADTYFGPEIQLHHLHSKQKAFVSWYNRYFKDIRSFPKGTTCGPIEVVDMRGMRIGILPINTALFCQDDDDKAKLWVGRRCLDRAIDELQKISAHATVAIFHHPFDWLDPAEQRKIRCKLRKSVGFLLRGHLHLPAAVFEGVAPEQAMHLAAGAAYDSPERPRSALFCTIDETRVTVRPICYEDQPRERWTVDASVFPEEEGHEKSFDMPGPARGGYALDIEQEILNAFGSVRGLFTAAELPGLIERLRPVLANIQLRADQYFNIYQKVAVAVSNLAHSLPDHPASRLLIGRVCSAVLAKREIQLAAQCGELDELYELAGSEEQDAPDGVLDWLLDHARAVGGDAA